MTPTRWIRLALAYQLVQSINIGFWATFAPRSFYDGFPGLGRTWMSLDGPYNEHLVRDVGALNLALTVVLAWAMVSLSRDVVAAACGASLAWGVPHLVYHATTTDGWATSDLVISLGGLVLFAALPVAIAVMARRHLRPEGVVSAAGRA